MNQQEFLLDELNRVKRHVTTAPTFTPRNLFEQIQFYDDGADVRAYFFINGVWKYITLT